MIMIKEKAGLSWKLMILMKAKNEKIIFIFLNI